MKLQPLVEEKQTPAGAVESYAGTNRPAQVALFAFFLAFLSSGILIQTTVELWRRESVGALEVFHQKPTTANLRYYERGLEDASVVARVLRPLFQFVQFDWLRDGGEKALIGLHGWLFYKPGYRAMLARTDSPITNDPIAAIVAWRDNLAARGIHLLVVPAPNKESLYPEYVTRRVVPGQTVMAPTTRDVLTRLKAANVNCVDLFALFAEARSRVAEPTAEPLYLEQDSHWSPAGIKLAAGAVAHQLLELNWIKRGGVEYRERPTTLERQGDILRMLQNPRLERRLPLERVQCAQVVRFGTDQLYQDYPQAEILILGDSFLRIFAQDDPGAAGFIAHLAKELSQPVASLVNNGGASTLVRQELFRRPRLLAGKKVVIWEFVERDLRLGTEGWQTVPLPPQEAATQTTDQGK
jgi:hypothetical protein